MSIEPQIRAMITEWVNDMFGEKFTGQYCLVSYTSVIMDMDKEEIELLKRNQGNTDQLFIMQIGEN